MQSIFAKLLYEIEKRHDTVLVTIIRESGSTPRGEGAQMLVGAQGPLGGTIGGGNVENLSILHARDLIAQRCSDLHEYPLHRSDAEDIGMVCGGDVTVLFTRIPGMDARWNSLAQKVMQCFAEMTPADLSLGLNGGLAALIGADGQLLAGAAPAPEEKHVLLPLPLGERALIFGAGHIARSLVPLLKTINFRPVVYDCRPECANQANFPDADQVIVGDFDHIADSLALLPDDYIVIMTNAHSHDFEVELQALQADHAYVGVIGSAKKTASVNARLRERGVTDDRLAVVHTPIGTAIKAITPAEIAVSIAGEMIYVRALRREGGQEAHHGCPMH